MEDYQGSLTGKQIDQLPTDMALLEESIAAVRTQANELPSKVTEQINEAKEQITQDYEQRTTTIIATLNNYRMRLAAL